MVLYELAELLLCSLFYVYVHDYNHNHVHDQSQEVSMVPGRAEAVTLPSVI